MLPSQGVEAENIAHLVQNLYICQTDIHNRIVAAIIYDYRIILPSQSPAAEYHVGYVDVISSCRLSITIRGHQYRFGAYTYFTGMKRVCKVMPCYPQGIRMAGHSRTYPVKNIQPPISSPDRRGTWSHLGLKRTGTMTAAHNYSTDFPRTGRMGSKPRAYFSE